SLRQRGGNWGRESRRGAASDSSPGRVPPPERRGILPPKGEDLMSKRNARITTPLVREDGVLRPATWDEALDRAAQGFRSAVEKKGGQTFGLFSCSKTTNELNYLAQKFARAVVGSNNIDSCNRT